MERDKYRDLATARLMSNVIINSSCCWIFTKIGPAGYGQFFYRGRTIGAHRASYMLFNGYIEDGMLVRHMCDVRACVNPRHLVIGTYKDNAQDRVIRGRCNPKRGMRDKQIITANAKLNEDQAREIRCSTDTNKGLARQYNVSPKLIRLIKTNQIWKHA